MEEKKVLSIKNLIFEIRSQKVMLDRDLAQLYEVEVKRLNEAVKRNIKRFPPDFMFQLTDEEWVNLRSQIATSRFIHGGRRYNPYVFTEQGVAMLSSVISSEQAIEVNIQIMRAFIQLRQFVLSQSGSNEQIAKLSKLLMLHIDNCDYKFTEYDETIAQVIEALNNLIKQPNETKKIGF
ncbi:MAG: ORF6N domain-containing protein [Treponema sp.]|nr:ORF6N domain-containing protein [Treponema sp.]MCL2252388.1 ORF6N domain-containing protein [Treponema sp.]